jgi:hypothetical protein
MVYFFCNKITMRNIYNSSQNNSYHEITVYMDSKMDSVTCLVKTMRVERSMSLGALYWLLSGLVRSLVKPHDAGLGRVPYLFYLRRKTRFRNDSCSSSSGHLSLAPRLFTFRL